MRFFERIKNIYHFLWAFFSALFFGFPSKKLKVIGVTGTGGKSTVVELTSRIFEEAGFKTASLSSIKIKIGKKEKKNLFKMTMPGRGYLQYFLWQAKKEDCQYVVIEVTSEGILQHRQKFIDFDVACFTNLFPEHIERHGSFENYREAKGKLFQATKKIHILNLDDENLKYFLKFPAKKKIGYKIDGDKIDGGRTSIIGASIIGAEDIQVLASGIKFFIQNKEFNLKLLGKFNIYNALTAICIAFSQGIDLETCQKALEKIEGIPGRMEIVIEKPFKVIVDYAHTPDALEKVYQTIHGTWDMKHETKMICVLGACGGGRDKWKRPELGKIAEKYCDKIILTNEDPYNENPLKIIKEIEGGLSQIQNYEKILDRKEAIKKALSLARLEDIVIITGKGSEPWMCLARGRKIPWDDREIVKEEFKKTYGKI